MKSRLVAVVRKEFREIRRDPLLIWIAAAVPVVLLFLFGYAISLDVRAVPMAVARLRHAPSSARCASSPFSATCESSCPTGSSYSRTSAG